MTTEQAITVWQDLASTSPHGCRIHLTGGEVFGDYERLLDVCCVAQQQKLILEAVETNAFWATDASQVRRRLLELSACGMGRLAISADPYHQQYVPIDRPRLLARVAEEVLGVDRVRVRWSDWLAGSVDISQLSPSERGMVFRNYASAGRDRTIGRAAAELPGCRALKPASDFVDNPCDGKLLRGRHVHVSPAGEIWLATCVGVSAGNALREGVAACWQSLQANWRQTPVIASLSRAGPAALLEEVRQTWPSLAFGYPELATSGFDGKCHLCFVTRLALLKAGKWANQLKPAEVYGLPAQIGC